MAAIFDPKAGPAPAPGATGADLNTDSTGEVFTPPSSGAGVATVGPDGYRKGGNVKAPDSDVGKSAGLGIRWVRDNAPKRGDVESNQMDPFEVLAGFVRAGDARAEMLARGAVEAGSAEVVASADRAGEPSMEELTRGQDLFDLFGNFENKANSRIEEISKGPGKKVT